MFDIGFLELLLIGVVALLVLGPERLPHAARTAGKWVGKARRMVRQVSDEIDRELKAEELREKLRKEGDTLGLEKIQGTVKSALDDAKQFKNFVESGNSESEPDSRIASESKDQQTALPSAEKNTSVSSAKHPTTGTESISNK